MLLYLHCWTFGIDRNNDVDNKEVSDTEGMYQIKKNSKCVSFGCVDANYIIFSQIFWGEFKNFFQAFHMCLN